MYADDHRDTINGMGRQLRRMATHELLDTEDLVHTFGVIQQQLDAARATAVTHLRERGESWTTIGKALGISRQAAQQKYGPQECQHPSWEPGPTHDSVACTSCRIVRRSA